MRAGNPINAMASALYSALYRDLSPIDKMHQYMRSKLANESKPVLSRPDELDVTVVQFSQVWGSTALGFGGIGGSAMTAAYTTIVHCSVEAAVYFNGRLAYIIGRPNGKFYEDEANQSMVEVSKSSKYIKD